ncbi:MAG: hypothetical protein V1728_02835 [Candidatus Micrarchaeota archaeon]
MMTFIHSKARQTDFISRLSKMNLPSEQKAVIQAASRILREQPDAPPVRKLSRGNDWDSYRRLPVGIEGPVLSASERPSSAFISSMYIERQTLHIHVDFARDCAEGGAGRPGNPEASVHISLNDMGMPSRFIVVDGNRFPID